MGPMSWSQIRSVPDSARICRIWDRNGSGPGSQLLITSFLLVIHQVFQYDCYSQALNKNPCAVSFLRKIGPGYVSNATSEQIKPGLRLRAHARYAFSRIWDRPNLGALHRVRGGRTFRGTPPAFDLSRLSPASDTALGVRSGYV